MALVQMFVADSCLRNAELLVASAISPKAPLTPWICLSPGRKPGTVTPLLLVKQLPTRRYTPPGGNLHGKRAPHQGFRALRISNTRSTFVRPISSKACVRVTASKFASTKARHFSRNEAAACWSAAWKIVAAFST